MATESIWPSRDDFTRAVEVITELQRRDAARVLVGAAPPSILFAEPNRRVRFELRPDSTEADAVVEGKGFTRATFERAARDVADILSALAQGISEERFYQT